MTMFTNENRKSMNHAVTTADLIQHVKEAEARVERLEQRNKALFNELTVEKLARKKAEAQAEENARLYEAFVKGNRYAKELLTVKDNKISKLESWLDELRNRKQYWEDKYWQKVNELAEVKEMLDYKNKTAEDLWKQNYMLMEDNKLLKQLAKDLHSRLKSWQQIAKNLFRKNRDLDIESICKECEVDEAYDRIRELENELNEKDWIIQQQKEELNAYKMWEEMTTMGSILSVTKEIAGYEMESCFIEDWHDRSVEYEIKRLDLRDEILQGLGYIATEAAELESKLRVEITLEELEDSNF